MYVYVHTRMYVCMYVICACMYARTHDVHICEMHMRVLVYVSVGALGGGRRNSGSKIIWAVLYQSHNRSLHLVRAGTAQAGHYILGHCFWPISLMQKDLSRRFPEIKFPMIVIALRLMLAVALLLLVKKNYKSFLILLTSVGR